MRIKIDYNNIVNNKTVYKIKIKYKISHNIHNNNYFHNRRLFLKVNKNNNPVSHRRSHRILYRYSQMVWGKQYTLKYSHWVTKVMQ